MRFDSSLDGLGWWLRRPTTSLIRLNPLPDSIFSVARLMTARFEFGSLSFPCASIMGCVSVRFTSLFSCLERSWSLSVDSLLIKFEMCVVARSSGDVECSSRGRRLNMSPLAVFRGFPYHSHFDRSPETNSTNRSISVVSMSAIPAFSPAPTMPMTISPPFPPSSATAPLKTLGTAQLSLLAALAVARRSLSNVCRSM